MQTVIQNKEKNVFHEIFNMLSSSLLEKHDLFWGLNFFTVRVLDNIRRCVQIFQYLSTIVPKKRNRCGTEREGWVQLASDQFMKLCGLMSSDLTKQPQNNYVLTFFYTIPLFNKVMFLGPLLMWHNHFRFHRKE